MSKTGTNWADAMWGWAQAFTYVGIVGIIAWTYVQTDGCTAGERVRAEIRQMQLQEPTDE